MSFFDFLNAINDNKKDLIRQDPSTEKDYVPFMVNRGLSYFSDTIMFANEMNQNADICKSWQFDFYRIGIPKKKRFSKWHKRDQNSDDINLVMREYGYSAQKAAAALELLTENQIKQLQEKYTTGGR
jgi:NACalpha-BTF3-like transcription factor